MYLDPQEQQPQAMLCTSSSITPTPEFNINLITARIFVNTTEYDSSTTCNEEYPPRNSLLASYNQAAFFACSELQIDDDDNSSLSSSSSSSSVLSSTEGTAFESASPNPNSSDDSSTSSSRKRLKRNVHFNETVTTFDDAASSSSNSCHDDDDDDIPSDTIWYTLDDYKRFRAHHKVIARFVQGLYQSSCTDKDQIFYDMIYTNVTGMTTETPTSDHTDDAMFCLRGLEGKVNTNYRKQSHQRKHNIMTAVLAEQERQFMFPSSTSSSGSIPNDVLIRNEAIQYSAISQEIAHNLAKKDEEIAFQLFHSV